jgi:ABC-2 type transport system permease protein
LTSNIATPLTEVEAKPLRGIARILLWVRAFLRRDLLTEISYRANFLFGLAGGLFAILTFFFLSQVVESAAPGLSHYRGGYFPFVLVGLAVTAFLNEALTGFARRVRQAQLLGTLEAVLATPIPPAVAILCQAVHPLFGAALRASLYLLFGAILFGAEMATGNLPAAALALALGVVCFGALGILSASATMVLKRGDPIAWAIGGLSVLLGGVYYPVEVLPPELATVAQALPMTHTLRALREALLGDGGAALMGALATLAIFAAVLVPLSLVTFAWAVRRARREGSLTHF